MGRFLTVTTACALAIGGFLFGYDSGIISSTIAQPHFIDYFEDPSDSAAGGIVSAFTGGAIIGSLMVFYLCDWLGRKLTVFIGSAIAVFGCALQAGATTIAMLIAGRFIAGVAVGLLSATVPMYCSEIAEARYRGALSGLLQWMIGWGFFAAQWIGYGCTHVDSHFQWRFPLAFQVIPGVILCAAIWFLEESPRWLVEKDRNEEAREVLRKLHGDGTNDDYIDLEHREIVDAYMAEKSLSVIPWKAIVTKPSWRRRLILGCGVQAFCQLSGVNVINYYGPRLYDALGFDTQTSLMIIGINGSLSIIWNSLGLWLLDRLGRKMPLVGSAAGMAATLLLTAVLFQYYDAENGNQLRAQVAMWFLFTFFFTFTGIISWVYPAEIFPLEVRAKGNSVSTFTNWSLNLVISQVSPLALTGIDFKYFYVFFAFNLIASVCYWLFYPETKGRTLEQMDEVFGDQIVPHALRDPTAAAAAMEKENAGMEHVEDRTVR